MWHASSALIWKFQNGARDLIVGALCMSSCTNSDRIVFITAYIHIFRKSLQAASPEVLITHLPASFCLLGCDQKLRYDLERPNAS